ncbi:uncharacterized protein LOC113797242 isoform X1 [Dermatophagoides pteronyssinus]|uniref:uncharacterized protein LOC113797242 isoform X1 n=2 Tax=Dermatophagoides pteronyssinus TaxID=6956 RepID=UPI003F67B5A3
MKLSNSISNGIARMESKLMGVSTVTTSGNEMETGSMSGTELIGGISRQYEPTAMIIARLIARTMLFMTVIIGSFILVSVYIQSKSSLRCQEFTTAESNNVGGPYFEPMMATSESDDEYAAGGRRQFPLSLRMSARAGEMMNAMGDDEKGHVNCVIERKTANQIIASEPKKLMTPFGNITTDPRLVHLTGEKLIFSCHNGDDDQKLSKEGNPILRPSISDDNDEHQSEPQPKPLRQLIIISGRPMNKINDNDNSDKDDGKDLVKSIKNNESPSPINSLNRNKRQAELPKKECACKCAC